jgi:hypothetical protein
MNPSSMWTLPARAARGTLIALSLTACAAQESPEAAPDLTQITQAAGGGNGAGTGDGAGTGNSGGNPNPSQPLNLDVRRSLVVTEQPILARFSFVRVMDQLVAQSDVPGLTSLELFRQWWDTNNYGAPDPAHASGLGLGPNCDSELSPEYGPSLNGFPFTCRADPAEGKQTQCTSLTDPACAYIPIGLFNRFDLAPVDGAHCGEHRIVYAKQSGIADGRDRNLLIFEGILPNPLPHQGIKGCRKIVEDWAALTSIADIEERADRLEQLYFEGHGNVPPVVHIAHFGDNALGAGQVRTNQFMAPSGSGITWSLRDFKLLKSGCPGDDCTMQMVPVTVKNNPFGPLFAATAEGSGITDFQADFIARNVATLSATSLSDIGMSTDEAHNAAQSNSSGPENNYANHFLENASFHAAIQAKLTDLGSALSPTDIVARALTQSCAGCHQLSNNKPLGNGLSWPPSLGFAHVTERSTEVVDGVTRFLISPALINAFLPVRKEVMEGYLAEQPGRHRGTGRTIGGSETH